jgi:type I restriction enzyme S subunit
LQRERVVEILGALDDKIELNRKMNATLEQMARALFQSWFVDFDPVHAKAAGRQPIGMDKATADLFPHLFVDSELGKIPKGWETSSIGAKLKTILGGTPSRAKTEYWEDGKIAWINSGKTNDFRIIEPSELITKDALQNSATKLLPSRTTVLAITGATLGQVSIAEIECCANQSVIAILASEQFPTEFIYPWIKENIGVLIASQTGGAQQHINKGNVDELLLLCPDYRIVNAYQLRAKPIFDKIALNCFQSQNLAELRDTLLPKLLSGELSVK